jgi:hypothetical protein
MPTTVLAVVILGLVLLVWRRRSSAVERAPRATTSALAAPAVTASRDEAPDFRGMVLRREFLAKAAPAPDGHARAVVMDWSLDRGAATLVAYDEGTTSLYYSSGGGVIGAGAHDAVRRAAAAFRAEAARTQPVFTAVPASDPMALPPANAVAFYLITDSATLRAGPITTAELSAGSHTLGSLGNLAQAVISAVREVGPR